MTSQPAASPEDLARDLALLAGQCAARGLPTDPAVMPESVRHLFASLGAVSSAVIAESKHRVPAIELRRWVAAAFATAAAKADYDALRLTAEGPL